MKTLLILLLSAASALAAPGLVWDANPEPDVAEYRLYLVTGPVTARVYTLAPAGVIPAPRTSYTLPFPIQSPATYVVTARSADGLESLYSEEVTVRVPGKPVNLRKAGNVGGNP